MGQQYLSYLGQIFTDMIVVYKHYSQFISNSIRQSGSDSLLKPMKALWRDILRLIQTYIERETDFTYFNQYFLPSLQELMQDFANSDPFARDPETLMLFATILRKDG